MIEIKEVEKCEVFSGNTKIMDLDIKNNSQLQYEDVVSPYQFPDKHFKAEYKMNIKFLDCWLNEKVLQDNLSNNWCIQLPYTVPIRNHKKKRIYKKWLKKYGVRVGWIKLKNTEVSFDIQSNSFDVNINGEDLKSIRKFRKGINLNTYANEHKLKMER